MYLKIIGDPKDAQAKMKTNIPLRTGQLLSADKNRAMSLAQQFPDTFDCVDESGTSYKELFKPKNKLANKGGDFKSKAEERRVDTHKQSEEYHAKKKARKKKKKFSLFSD